MTPCDEYATYAECHHAVIAYYVYGPMMCSLACKSSLNKKRGHGAYTSANLTTKTSKGRPFSRPRQDIAKTLKAKGKKIFFKDKEKKKRWNQPLDDCLLCFLWKTL